MIFDETSPAKRRRHPDVTSGDTSTNFLQNLSETARGALFHARRCSSAATLRHQLRGAVWYADKAFAISGAPEDAFLLAEAHYRAGAGSRALAVLESKELLDVSLSAPANGSSEVSGVRGDRLAYFYLGALCMRAAGADDKALELLEAAMEGKGQGGLRTPLGDGLNFGYTADCDDGTSGGGALAGTINSQSSGTSTDAVWRIVSTIAQAHGNNLAAFSENVKIEYPPPSYEPVFISTGGIAEELGKSASNNNESRATSSSLCDGSRLNLISAMASVRGEILLATDNRLRATQWFIAALRIDPHNAVAHMVRRWDEGWRERMRSL